MDTTVLVYHFRNKSFRGCLFLKTKFTITDRFKKCDRLNKDTWNTIISIDVFKNNQEKMLNYFWNKFLKVIPAHFSRHFMKIMLIIVKLWTDKWLKIFLFVWQKEKYNEWHRLRVYLGCRSLEYYDGERVSMEDNGLQTHFVAGETVMENRSDCLKICTVETSCVEKDFRNTSRSSRW